MAEAKNELTPRRQRFVEEYHIDLNAALAAVRAGYSEKTAGDQGSRLPAGPANSEAVEKGKARLSTQLERSALDTLMDLRSTAEEAREAGNYAAAIKAYEVELKYHGAVSGYLKQSAGTEGEKPLSPVEATEQILRAHGMWEE